jgi:5-methylcytosine-specific restriction endonuclease McrA
MTAADARYQTRQWKALAYAIRDRDRGLCQIRAKGCTTWATAVDHVTSPVEGGDFWDPANLRAACRPCNSSRGAALAHARTSRYRTTTARYQVRL